MIFSRILSDAKESPVLFEDGKWWSGGELLSAGLALADQLADQTGIVCRSPKTTSIIAAAVSAEATDANVTYVDPNLDLGAVGIEVETWSAGLEGVAKERVAVDSPLVEPLRTISYGFMSSGSTATPNRVVRSVQATSVDSTRIAGAVYQGYSGVVLAAPSFHLYGFSHLVAALGMGLRVWAAKPSATLSVLSAAVDRPDVQVFTGLPFHLDLILGSSTTDVFSRLAAIISSAGKLHSETIEQSLIASLPLFNVYGSTETGTLSIGDMRSVSDPLGYVGRPLPDVEIRLASPDSDEDVLHVRTGGLADGVIRGTHYDEGLAVDGWFPTSDIGRVEPKGIWLVGRQADFLKVAGMRVSCSRIREVLLRYSGVADVEVFGVEDKVRGEVPGCRVVLNPGFSVESLRTWCAAELGPVEVPRFIESVDHIPRSATGKIMRWL